MDILLAVAGIAVLAIVLVAVALVVRKKYMNQQSDASQGTGFTLSDFRRMHREGQLSDAEYEAAKASLLAHTRAASGINAPAAPQGQDSEISQENPPASPPDSENIDDTGPERPAS